MLKNKIKNLRIRPYQDSDLPRIKQIYNVSKLDELRFETQRYTLIPLERDETRFEVFKKSALYIAERDDDVLGFGGRLGSEISMLFVCPAARGFGVGKTLFEFLLGQIDGATNLCVAKSNWPAKRLYQHYGFKVIREFETEYNGIPVIANEMSCTFANMQFN